MAIASFVTTPLLPSLLAFEDPMNPGQVSIYEILNEAPFPLQNPQK